MYFAVSGWVSVQELEECITTLQQVILLNRGIADTLIRYCQDINSLSEEELRKLKREIRSEALAKETGAHIGLIQTRHASAEINLNSLLTIKDAVKAGFYPDGSNQQGTAA
ncbi:MAG: DUF6272 family protein [Marinilabiliales bacterium]|nr:DUF6272 family protein [Marinilabiliales bacterium]